MFSKISLLFVLLLLYFTNAEYNPHPNGHIHFEDPRLAYEILTRLDLQEPYNNGWTDAKAFQKYKINHLGLTSDFNYCEKHRLYYVDHPGYVYDQINFLTSYRNTSIVRKSILQIIGNEVMPDTHESVYFEPTDPEAIDIAPNVNLIVTYFELYFYRQIHTQHSCLGQMANHLPGHETLYRKDTFLESLAAYENRFKNKSQCFDPEVYFPKTYKLTDARQCKEFFKKFNSPEYQALKQERKIVYFRKTGSGAHGADGVFAVDTAEEIQINTLYSHGELCGQVLENNLMQYYIYNPLLLNGRKFDFRVFMLIASVNPFIVYYHDGLLRVSLSQYNPNGGNMRQSLMPNSQENDDVINYATVKGSYKGKTLEEIREEYIWNFDRLQKYLIETGQVTDPNWLDNYLRPQFKKAMIHLIRMSQHGFLKISSVFELFGVDFVMDEDLNLWFIEANCRSAVEGTTPFSRAFFIQMYKDQYEIAMGILRSRMKRVYKFVNNLMVSQQAFWTFDGEVYIEDFEENLKEFKKLTQNNFEAEFLPNENNGFSKIVDENFSGPQRYGHLIDSECL